MINLNEERGKARCMQVMRGRRLDIEHSFAALKSFMILDQLMASVSSDLRLFLKENDVHGPRGGSLIAPTSGLPALHSYPKNNTPSDRRKQPSLIKAA